MNQKHISVALLIALVGFPQISETIYTPALPSVVSGLLTSPYMVELTLSIYFLGFAMGVLLWGTISDYRGRRFSMLSGLLIYGIGTFACANASSIEALLAWRFLQAFGASVGSVVTQAILRDAYEGKERAKLFSVMSGALCFSPAIGPLLGGFISEYLGWRANFFALTTVAFGLFFWAWNSLPETRPKMIQKSDLTRLVVRMMTSCNLWGHIFLIGATNGILFGFYQEAPFVFIEQLGMSPAQYGCFGLLIAGSTLVAARISYKNGQISLIQKGAVCVLLGGVILTATVLTGAFNISISIVALFLIFLGVGLIIPNSLSHALKPYQETAGSAGSIFGGSYYLLIAGFTWLMGAMHNGTSLPLPVYITLLGLVIILGNLLIRKNEMLHSTS